MNIKHEQVHVTNSLAESDDVDEKTAYIEDLKKSVVVYEMCVECNESGRKGMNSQINTVHSTKCLKWIPYENIKNIVPINKESSSKIYSAD
ncbi:hypothetical protein C1646_752213 [Rhizophagus diaphanus]|nr:hypothetical protein C1646_752213 [Rhizophagus diaphanus] [Rhizophagus sp. MUCL 43196]